MIWPRAHAAWDFLSVHLEEKSSIYLNSALDVERRPIISSPGKYVLGYEVFAEHFPVLRFGVELSVSNDPFATQERLVESPFS